MRRRSKIILSDDDSPTPEQDRALERVAAMLAQARAEFGRRGRATDIHTLIQVGLGETPWPRGASLEEVQRLERVDSWGRPGFNMIRSERCEPWREVLTPRGREALDRIIAAFVDEESEASG